MEIDSGDDARLGKEIGEADRNIRALYVREIAIELKRTR